MINNYSNLEPSKGSRILCGRSSFRPILFGWVLILLPAIALAQTTIAFDGNSQPLLFGVSRIEKALQKSGRSVNKVKINADLQDIEIVINIIGADPKLRKEGYALSHTGGKLQITAIDPVGAMYGALDLAEQIIEGKTLEAVTDKEVNPHFTVRAIKFNLPWSSYRTGPAMQQHMEVCRDLGF